VDDATEEKRVDGTETQYHAGPEADAEVDHQIEQPGRCTRTQVDDQFPRSVFEAQHEQEEDDAQVGPGLDEVLGGDELEKTGVAEGEAAEQVKGDGAESDPGGQARQ